MPRMIQFGDDGTLEVAVFKPGTYHGGKVWTEADCNEFVESYDPGVHEAPSVIGHAQQRSSGDPAYGWTDSLFWRDGIVWARLKQVPAAFMEAVRDGRWKKRSVEIYEDFMGSGKKYLRAIAWLGATPPEVKGLPDATFAADEGSGDVTALEFEEPGQVRQLLDGLRGLLASFADDEEVATGPIEKTMARDEAVCQLEHISWIASDRMWEIVHDEDMEPEQKRAELQELFDELTRLIEEHGSNLINAFAERSPEMGAEQRKISMTPEELDERIQGAVGAALAQFQEQQSQTIDAKVKEGLAGITEQTQRNGVVAFCENLKGKGLAPVHVDGGLVDFMMGLDFAEVKSFGEGNQRTSAAWFQEFLVGLLDAARAGNLVVPFGEVAGGAPPAGNQDLKTLAIAEFEEHKAYYSGLGLTAEDLEKQAEDGRITLEPAG